MPLPPKGLQREDDEVVLTVERQTTEWRGGSRLPTCMMNAVKTAQMLDLWPHEWCAFAATQRKKEKIDMTKHGIR